MTAGCCEKTDFQASRFLIDRISRLSFSLFLPHPVFLFFSPVEPPFPSLFRLRADRWDSRSAWLLYCVSLSRDEFTRSIGAWQKCNAREVRGHRLRSYACEGEKQGSCAPGLHPRSALCELSHRAFARPRYETLIIRIKWGIRWREDGSVKEKMKIRRWMETWGNIKILETVHKCIIGLFLKKHEDIKYVREDIFSNYY